MDLVRKLKMEHRLTPDEYRRLLASDDAGLLRLLREEACRTSISVFGHKVYLRGLIEVTNVCRNNCLYCGIRAGNTHVERYRLTAEQILACCQTGYEAGFHTFVLQGGEDPLFTDDFITEVVSRIHSCYPDCAITLSLGEKEEESYRRFYAAGANRYLLRHETYNAIHYGSLHPKEMSCSHRQGCIRTLKRIGYQTGTGMMVGSPYQTLDHVVEDICFIEQLEPEMIGLGPFLPQHDTPFGNFAAGSLTLTLKLLSIFRLMFPHALIPSTTALNTLVPDGRKLGVLSGANVIMPNLSPPDLRSRYSLYDHKRSCGAEALEGLRLLDDELHAIGYEISMERGDYK